jgi:hypothetical protein
MSVDELKQQIRTNVEQFGCHVMHVAGEEGLPPFSYSVGIQRSSGAPEAIVIGLEQPLAHDVIIEYNRRVRGGEAFVGFLENFELIVERVDPEFYEEYLGAAMWLYDGPSFEIVQLIYPTMDGRWPWDPTVSDAYRQWQPVLTRQRSFSAESPS